MSTRTVHDVVVDLVADAAEGVRSLVLRPVSGETLPAWTPGAHIDVVLPSGIVRQYSLCGDPADRDGYRIGVLREPDGRGGSVEVHADLEVGSKLEVRAPRNQFPLLPSGRYLFIAGGIGITPILPMVAAADAAGGDWALAYGGRSRSSMAFVDELARYADRVRIVPEDEQGLLDLDGLLGSPQPDTLVYACGPAAMLEAVARHTAGWSAGSLHTERFSGDAALRTDDHAFEVVLNRSGATYTVPADQSILRTLEAGGVDVPSSCTQGMCGTCEQTVVEGLPDHRDDVLTPEEREAGEYILICVSRCRGDRLVLDL